MIVFIEYVFWIGLGVIAYTYVGYAMLMFVITKLKAAKLPVVYRTDDEFPEATMVIAAYNESDFIEEKIKNTLTLDYPEGKLKIYVVTDGSTDNTPELVARYPQVELFHEPRRSGKIHAVNRVMQQVRTPVTVFSDANTLLNKEVLKNMIRHYKDPQVGGIAGEKRVFKNAANNAAGGEGIYWKYESYLKKMDSELYSVMGAAGELFSVRTALFEPPASNMIIEDFYVSMEIVSRGHRFVYEPEAYAMETASATIDEEWKRKVRIAAGGFQAIAKLKRLFNFFHYGVISFEYISHRVLRWTLAPLALCVVLIGNILLVALSANLIYDFLLVCQVFFYGSAILGYLYRNKGITIKGFFVPFYFLVMNLSVYFGFARYLGGKQSVVWERAKRA